MISVSGFRHWIGILSFRCLVSGTQKVHEKNHVRSEVKCSFVQWNVCRKRHKAWSNCSLVSMLCRGVLKKADREKCIVKTTKKTVKDGRTTYSGNKFLKHTQSEPQFLKVLTRKKVLFRAWFRVKLCPERLKESSFCVRSYPISFGLRMQRLFWQTKGSSTWTPSPDRAAPDAPKVFFEKPWADLWGEASVLEACIYLRGSIHLATTVRWKEAFPETLDLSD